MFPQVDSESPVPVAAVVAEKGGSDNKMRCVQCNRERKLSVARTPNFCTQRCIIQWMEEHPDKSLKDAMGDATPSPISTLPTTTAAKPSPPPAQEKSGKNVSRALKNLQIDMAPPGTKLPQLASDDSGEEPELPKPALKNGPTLRAQTAAKRAVAVHLSKTTPTAGTKRPSSTPQPGSVKKAAKPTANGSTPKSVTFNLGVNAPISSSEPTGGAISIVPLDRLSGPLGNALLSSSKKSVLATPSSTAKGKLPDACIKVCSIVKFYFYFTIKRAQACLQTFVPGQ